MGLKDPCHDATRNRDGPNLSVSPRLFQVARKPSTIIVSVNASDSGMRVLMSSSVSSVLEGQRFVAYIYDSEIEPGGWDLLFMDN